jgi:hypothetical protein
MIRWALRGAIDQLERDGDCDLSYMREMIGMALGGLARARSRRIA